MIKRYGTRSFRGMNSATAPHLIGDDELATASNVSFSEYGSVKPGWGVAVEVAGPLGSNVRGLGIYEDDGRAIYKYDQVIVCDGDQFGLATGNANDTLFLSLGDRTYMADGSENHVYDGTSYRDQGPMIPSDVDGGAYTSDSDELTSVPTFEISDIAVDGDGLITVTTDDVHGLSTGDRIYFDNFTSMVELDDRIFTITVTDTDEFTLDGADGTGYTAYSSPDGDLYSDSHGSTAGRKYRVSYKITLPSGETLETDAFQIKDADDVDTFSVDDVLDRLWVYWPKATSSDIAGYTSPSSGAGYTIGTDILVNARIWRTKAGGSEYYLVKEASHADSYGSGTAGFYDSYHDNELGAVWADEYDGHGAPPASTMLAHAGNRIYCNDSSNPRRVYFSGLFQYDYFGPLDYITMPEDVTALGVFDDYLVIFGINRMWRYSNTDGIGHLDQIDAPEGCASRWGVVSSSYGLFFVGEQGIYRFTGGVPEDVSPPIKDRFASQTNPWRAHHINRRLLFFSQPTVFILELTPFGPAWSYYDISDSDTRFIAGEPSEQYFYGISTSNVSKYSSDDETSLTIDTKFWGNGMPCRVNWVYVDCESTDDDGFSVVLYPETVGSGETLATGQTTTGRKTVRFSAPNDEVSGHWQVRLSGSVQVYGISLETYR